MCPAKPLECLSTPVLDLSLYYFSFLKNFHCLILFVNERIRIFYRRTSEVHLRQMGALVLAYNGLAVIAEGLWRSPLSHCKNSERCFLGLYPISTNTDSIKASFLLISPFFIVIQLWVEAVRLVPPGDLLQMLFHKVVVSRCVSHTKPNNTNNASIVPFLWLVSRGRDCCHKTPQSCYRNGQAEETVL